MSMKAKSRKLHRLIGIQIKNLRSAGRLKQEALASRVGLSRTSITNIEGGKQRILIDQLYAIADALSVEPCRLLPARSQLNGSKGIPPNPRLSQEARAWVKKVVGKGQI